jgi:hypothetical protein
MPGLVALIAAAIAWLLYRIGRRRSLPAQTVIVSPAESTVIAADGAVRSVQSALLTLPEDTLEQLWSPESLEDLGATYWWFLSRATLHLIRVLHSDKERSVVLVARPLTLLRFDQPEYVLEPNHGRITWRIKDGLLVARRGCDHGWLSVDVRRLEPTPGAASPDPEHPAPGQLRIEVEVANFYPAIASWLGTLVYEGTQAVVHVLVTHAFLRSLANLELERSKVGRLR